MRKILKVLVFIICFNALYFNVSADVQQEVIIENNGDLINQISLNQFEIIVDDTYRLPAKKITLPVKDGKVAVMVPLKDEIPVEVEKAIQEKIKKGATEINIYLPEEDTASDLLRARRETSFYKYKNVEMKAVVLTSTNESSGYKTITSGVNAKSAAKSIASILLTCAGAASKRVNVCTTGVSLLKDFLSAVSLSSTTKIEASASDYVQLNVSYDDADKFVYAKRNGRWTLGLIAKKITLRKISNCQYYKNSGKPHKTRERRCTEFLYSKNFKQPNAVALKQANQALAITEKASWEYKWTDAKGRTHKKSFTF